ncbi:hypothetical protein SEPCBS119000_002338 [Sporothrix epigloea]|uniref:Uncharacterized protein n=1 Tax=Sporothrix epigloea TaxID=1892477 RepID=A0ABP0DFN1_9PEZI
MLWDPEDEAVPASPTGLPKSPATPKKNKAQASASTVTPPALAPASRSEIPSSQPSPFTPVMLFDCSQRSMDQQSPLLDKAARRFTQQGNGDGGAATERVLHTKLCGCTHEQSVVANANRKALGKCSYALCMSGEIPDSDEEDIGLSGPLPQSQGEALRASRSGPSNSISSSPAVDTASPTISAPLSSPLSPLLDAWPMSPEHLPELRQITAADVRTEVSKAGSADSIKGTEFMQKSIRSNVGLQPSTKDGALAVSQAFDQEQITPAPVECGANSSPVLDCTNTQAAQPQYSQGSESQRLESQRVPLEVIRRLGPQTDRSDIIISLHPEQIRRIVSGTKDHDFRSYKIPNTVSRFWIYATRPVCELQYMAVVAAGFRHPGEIDSESGFGNADFNAGRLVAKYAYKLVQVYQLNNPVPLDVMRKNGWTGAPCRYDYLPPAVVGSLLGNLRCALFEDAGETDHGETGSEGPRSGDLFIKETQFARKSPVEKSIISVKSQDGARNNHSSAVNGELSESQEIEAQLLGDIFDTQASHNTHSLAPKDSPGQFASSASSSKACHISWRSQTTMNDAVSATLEISSRASAQFQNVDTNLGLEQRAGVRVKNESVGENDRHGLDRASRYWQSSPTRQKILAVDPQRPPPLSTMVSSVDFTQAALPESLYEEIRQAPPVVILDSEDSDDGD